jgi:1-acyl-sn-glycerol-3-phosphate acyltransferase
MVILRTLLLLYASLSLLVLTGPVVLLVLPLSLHGFRRCMNDVVVVLWLNAVACVLPDLCVALTGARIQAILDKVDEARSSSKPASKPASKATHQQLLDCVSRTRSKSAHTSTLILSNHVIDTDFLVVWLLLPLLTPRSNDSPLLGCLSRHYGGLKIVLKSDLKDIPILGHGMKAFEFLFLSRDTLNRAKDKQSLREHFGRYLSTESSVDVLLFPEGTTLNTTDASKSRKYVTKINRERGGDGEQTKIPALPHGNVMYPRASGVNLLKSSLRESTQGATSGHGRSHSAKLLDLTIAYNGYNTDVPSYEDGYGRKRDKRVTSVKKLLCSYSVWGLTDILWAFDSVVRKFVDGKDVSDLYCRSNDVSGNEFPICIVDVDECGLADDDINGEYSEGWIYERWAKKDRIIEDMKYQRVWMESRPGETGVLKNGNKFVTLSCPKGNILLFWMVLLFPFWAIFWYSVFLLCGGAFVIVAVYMFGSSRGKNGAGGEIRIF